ncbi:unnamed protein product, partial [Vitis vinifera]
MAGLSKTEVDTRKRLALMLSKDNGVSSAQKPPEDDIASEKRVFSVRLGKFRGLNGGGGEEGVRQAVVIWMQGDVSRWVRSNMWLLIRTCRWPCGHTGNSSTDGDVEGKKISIGSKDESFSVSKIWLWPKKGKFPSSSDTHIAFTFLFALNFFGAKLCDYDSFVLNFMANGCNVLLSFQLFSTHL